MSVIQEIEHDLIVLLAKIEALFHKAKAAAPAPVASATGTTGVSGATGVAPKA